MDKFKVESILKQAMKSGTKQPGIFEIPTALKMYNALESKSNVDDIVSYLRDNETNIKKMYGLSDNLFDECVEKLNELKE